ncbi:MAG TPA: DUF4157 domain-containing protein [Longimicrobium sp.]|nr:DUF4157 domain-containing protein [Longimicrobium sp.]
MRVFGPLLDRVLGPEVPPPPGLPPGLVPPGVVFRAGRLVPWIGGVLGRMAGPAHAVTLRRTIVIHPALERVSARLVAHELAHVRQWDADPLFPVRYTWESVRRGYLQNRYEVEARAEAERAFPPPDQPEEPRGHP